MSSILARTLTALPVALVAAALTAQTPPTPAPETRSQQPPFRTEANFVRVDVYPTRDGKPVPDLRREDFELLEDNRPQAIDSFEYIRVGAAGSQETRSDPTTIEAMRQTAADPKNRIFVIFLDAAHVTTDAAQRVGRALVQFVDRMLGPDDLVGLMTSWMSPAGVTLARKTQVIQSGLNQGDWGRRFTAHEDEREAMYKLCYRVLKQEMEQGKTVSDVARALIVRRREELTLGALRDLVVYLRGIREERKAILLVSEGWALYRPDTRITRLREECTCPPQPPRRDFQDCGGCQSYPPGRPWKEPVPGADPIRVGPGGRLEATPREPESEAAPIGVCTADRMRLANIDHSRDFRDLMNDANRANASFYTIDPRGLTAFDTPMGRDPDEIGVPPSVVEDQQSLSRRLGSLSDLAMGTDGIALTNSNDLTAGLRRIADDLSSYYLLGYYSTNGKLDGKYRSITVSVKRPGVQVRARPGYRAPTEAEVAAARAVTTTIAGARAAAPTALASAFASLARIRPEPRFRLHAALGSKESGAGRTVWIAGELPALQDWSRGASVGIDVAAGAMSNSTQIVLKQGERAFLTSVVVENPTAPIDVRARVANPDPSVTGFTDAVRLDLAAAAPQPLLFRRGPTTANRLQPAADFQFARSDRLRVEVPLTPDMTIGTGRLLDKAGQELKVPVAAGERTDAGDGRQRWLTADLTLAPLGAGDYVVELTIGQSGGEQKVLAAFRVAR